MDTDFCVNLYDPQIVCVCVWGGSYNAASLCKYKLGTSVIAATLEERTISQLYPKLLFSLSRSFKDKTTPQLRPVYGGCG